MVEYRKALLKSLEYASKLAGRAWLKAAIEETPIPVWSGASRATFSELAHELGVSISISNIRTKYDKIAEGQAASSGGVFSDPIKMEAGFNYETSLGHLAYNEYNKAMKGRYPQPWSNRVRFTPYHFQTRALDAWAARAAKYKMPNPYRIDFLKRRKL